MKICCRCKKEKKEEEFNYKVKKLQIRQKACKECTRAEVKKHYLNNKAYYLVKAQKRNSLKRKVVKEYIWNYLSSHPCIDCGEKDPVVLEFDHVGAKKFTISSNARNHHIEDVIIEINNCEVRCANCHRRKTSRQFGWNKAPVA